jgi:hypothetical protein
MGGGCRPAAPSWVRPCPLQTKSSRVVSALFIQTCMPRLGFEHVKTVIILNHVKRQGKLLSVCDFGDNKMKNEDNFETSTKVCGL